MAASAESTEGVSAPDPPVNLTASFKVGKIDCDVQLNQTHLNWDKPKRKDKSLYSHSVAIADIIAVKNSEPSVHSFTLHHLTRPKNHVWKVATVSFHTEDETTLRTWVDSLQTKLECTVAEQQRPRNVIVFVNPGSGNSQGVKIYEKHGAPLFDLAGVKTNVIVTERAKHAVDVLLECSLDGVDGIIAVGGDGTFNDVLTGALKHYMKEAEKDYNNPGEELTTCPIRLGIIPAGSGQGMVMMAAYTRDITTATLQIIMGSSIALDVISTYNDGSLVGYSSIFTSNGFFGESANYSESIRHLGKKRYVKTFFNMSKFMKFYDFDIHYLPADDTAEDSKNKPEPADHEGWCKVPGPFAGLYLMNLDLETFDPMNGSGYIHLITRPTMLGFFKMVARIHKYGANSYDSDCLKNIKVKMIKVVSGPSTETGTEAEAGTGTEAKCGSEAGASASAKQVPLANIYNIDGEVHKLSNPETLIRFHGANYHLFGTAPLIHERRQKTQEMRSNSDGTKS